MTLRYKIEIAYDGTDFSGWQLQPNAISIQGLLEKCAQQILSQHIRIIGSGRTDAGAHALGQIAHFDGKLTMGPERFQAGLNALLPKTIRILKVETTTDDFHAQYSAHSKIYHYRISSEPCDNPFTRRYTYRPRTPIDVDQLQKAIPLFIGTHDFTTFANVGGKVKNRVRTLFRIDLLKEERVLCLAFEGNGFLYKMVRNIVGTLLEVASGKLALEEIPKLFKAKDRRAAPKGAPACGLTLIRINYDASVQMSEFPCPKNS
ncbi:MAG: tRNA pseudouridine(38-40) synthase TruA [Chlamydiia bacterium]|nr:tRNA pseudouridine(38-40) synthase TruA [Chlamydiia bacterium]